MPLQWPCKRLQTTEVIVTNVHPHIKQHSYSSLGYNNYSYINPQGPRASDRPKLTSLSSTSPLPPKPQTTKLYQTWPTGTPGLRQAQADFPELHLTPASQPLTTAALAALSSNQFEPNSLAEVPLGKRKSKGRPAAGAGASLAGAGFSGSERGPAKGGLPYQQSLPHAHASHSSAAQQSGYQTHYHHHHHQQQQQQQQQQLQQQPQTGVQDEAVFALAAGDYQTLCLCSASR